VSTAAAATTTWSPWEVQAWLPPPLETVSDWAERCVRLPGGVSSIPGQLSLEHTPYLRAILDAITDPDTEKVVLDFSTQVGKTTCLIVASLHSMATDPWNQIYVMDSEEHALETKTERFEPIIRESPELAELIDGSSSFSGKTISINGRTITFRGSHSPGGLASKPVRMAFADEIDKWPAWAGKEADPVDLLEERMKTFHDSTLILASTPTTETGRIQRELERSSNERCFVPCPHCGTYQVLVFGDGSEGQPGIKWPKDVKISTIVDESLAWYECASCHERIEERAKRSMLERHVWAPATCKVTLTGDVVGDMPSKRRRGFHIWAGYALWPKTTWSRIAAKFLQSKGDPSRLMNFKNSWLAETYKVVAGELRSEAIHATKSHYWIGSKLPADADVVTFGVDVQSHREVTYHYYVVRAWGIGGKSWLVGYGTTNGWEQLYSILYESRFETQSGSEATKIMPVIDSGYRTGEVYSFCFANNALAYKGDSRGRKHLTESEIPIAPDSDEMIRLVVCNPDFYKTDLHRLIRTRPLRWHIPEQGIDDEYLEHMVAEQPYREVDKKTGMGRIVWKLKTPDLPNHYFDCEIMNLVAAGLAELGTRGVAAPIAAKPPERPAEPKREQPAPRRYGDPSSGYDSTFSGV